MATGWLRGTVKEVVSGDTVVVVGPCKPGGLPPEKSVTLSSVLAPKLARRDGSTKDEPYAWGAREYLRKLCIGKGCVFRIEHSVEAIGRDFGSVFLDQSSNVALMLVSEGWAKVKASGTQQSPFYEDLKKAEEQAQLKGAGLWNKDPQSLAAAVREIASSEDFNALNFLQRVGKGRPIAGIVEAVLNGSLLRVYLQQEVQYVTVALCGVQAPSMGRRPPPGAPPPEAAADAEGEEGAPRAAVRAPLTAAAVAGAAAPAASREPEPFAREAKLYTEVQTLNREVRVMIEGVDKFGNLFATVLYAEGDKAIDLGERLTLAGLAKVVEWSLKMMTTGGLKLREAERNAKLEKQGQWVNYVRQNTGQEKATDKFTGKVIEVLSGDCLMVKDVGTHVERRVNLSSIRAPRPATRERPSEPVGSDAKDFLRKKVIGKEVHVLLEYTRKIPVSGDTSNSGDPDRTLVFGNVDVGAEKKDAGRENLGEIMVKKGYASVIRHRSDEERSHIYEKLIEAEDFAKQEKLGIHSNKERSASRTNDLSVAGNAQRAKQHLPFLQRAGKMLALVEAVISGHRFKLSIPREGVVILFSPSGIKTPMRSQNASAGRPAVKGEPHAEEAYVFIRETLLQRNVEVEVETVDRGGTFLGAIVIVGAKPVDVGVALLTAGLAKLHPNFAADRARGGHALLAAQSAAKNSRLKVWENWTPEQDRYVESEDGDLPPEHAAGSHQNGAMADKQVVVTEVQDDCDFYVQSLEEPRVAWLAEQLRQLSTADAASIVNPLRVGQLCIGHYSQDGKWYRAYIERIQINEPRYLVYFIDFGNRESLPSQSVRAIESSLASVPPQAQLCQLAYVRVPGPGSEYRADAAQLLASLVGGGIQLLARIIAVERIHTKAKHPNTSNGKLIVELHSADGSINVIQELLKAGLVRLPSSQKIGTPAYQKAMQQLREFEVEARQRHKGMFRYGDPGDSDDENDEKGGFSRARR